MNYNSSLATRSSLTGTVNISLIIFCSEPLSELYTKHFATVQWRNAILNYVSHNMILYNIQLHELKRRSHLFQQYIGLELEA